LVAECRPQATQLKRNGFISNKIAAIQSQSITRYDGFGISVILFVVDSKTSCQRHHFGRNDTSSSRHEGNGIVVAATHTAAGRQDLASTDILIIETLTE